jgi:hypothetical protein
MKSDAENIFVFSKGIIFEWNKKNIVEETVRKQYLYLVNINKILILPILEKLLNKQVLSSGVVIHLSLFMW